MKSYTSALALLAATCSTTTAFIPSTTSIPSTSLTRVYSEAAPTPTPAAPTPTPEEPVAPPAPKIEYSASIPFLTKPKNLDGYVGDVGFDPFCIAENLDIKFMREAELKHGRIAMLAFVGFLFTEFIRLPGEMHNEINSVKAFTHVGPQPLLQIFLFCGVMEWITNKGKMTMQDMFEDADRVPGDLAFDPMGLSKNPANRQKYQLAELKNGRLAMIAIGGLIHHNFVTGHGTFNY
jgi:hypothetical protein